MIERNSLWHLAKLLLDTGMQTSKVQVMIKVFAAPCDA
ncbi:hypothetical protein DFO63_3904 [Stenotrophomonas sp. AG209]|nr:hypothetical protein DFO63_3904 [Stenotrophomonas sp. AG209]